MLLPLVMLIVGLTATTHAADDARSHRQIPGYIVDGLAAYERQGYDQAVEIWLRGSTFEHATAMATRIQFFRNIETLFGKYQSYDILNVKQTASSHMTYVRMNFERIAVYARFISMLKEGNWVLGDLHLSDRQNIPSG